MLLKLLLRVAGSSHHRRFARACADPRSAQASLLARLLARHADTAFGREHGFASIRSPAEFARRVPIRDYEAFRPYINRLVDGERRVLTREDPTSLTTTSGTTGEPKLLPVTDAWRREIGALMRLWLRLALRDHPRFFDGKILSVVSPAFEGRTAGGIPFGAMSGLIYRRLPAIVRRQNAIPYVVTLIRDADARYFVTMRLALAQSVSVVGTPNASTLLRLAETGASRGEEIVRAVRDGTLGIATPAAESEPGFGAGNPIATLASRLRPDRDRARFLEALIREHGRLLPRHCWPGLQLVACWLGGNAGLLARRLAPWYGPDRPRRDLGLLASEGRVTIPLEDGTPAGALAVHANYFEFIPEDRIDDPSAPALGAADLEDGKRYYVLLTGANGLYRYDLNDVVEVRGFSGLAPKVAFVRKGRDMLSITGEKLHLNHVEAAVHHAEAAARREVLQFRLIPDVERCRYDLLVELHGDGADVGREFAEAFDRHLGAANIEYASKRASKRLGAPQLWIMRSGWTERQCRADFRAGKRENQYKWPAMRDAWDDASRAEVLREVAESKDESGGGRA